MRKFYAVFCVTIHFIHNVLSISINLHVCYFHDYSVVWGNFCVSYFSLSPQISGIAIFIWPMIYLTTGLYPLIYRIVCPGIDYMWLLLHSPILLTLLTPVQCSVVVNFVSLYPNASIHHSIKNSKFHRQLYTRYYICVRHQSASVGSMGATLWNHHTLISIGGFDCCVHQKSIISKKWILGQARYKNRWYITPVYTR